MIKALLWLFGCTVLFWIVTTYLALMLWPEAPIVLWSSTAAVLCWAPTALTLAWTQWAFREKPDQQVLAVFGGASVRMAVVLAVGTILFLNVEAFGYQRFWIAIIVYYLFTLALEIVFLSRSSAVRERRKN